MREDCEHVGSCPLRSLINAITKKWALLIIYAIGYHERLRFNGLMDVMLDISPKTLSDNLKELESEGLIKRESFAEIPPRVEYTLTKDGKELRDAIIPLLKWVATKKGITEMCDPVCQRIPANICKYALSENSNTAAGGNVKP